VKGIKMRIIEIGTRLWKKCYATGVDDPGYGHCIVELEVTEPGVCGKYETSVMRGYNDTDKCRVRAARVLSITSENGVELTKAYSSNDIYFEYEVGAEVRPIKPFDEGDWACGSGIHGFETIEQAEEYNL
jgi:hypothetical protein